MIGLLLFNGIVELFKANLLSQPATNNDLGQSRI
jgi:hypothetical protein